MRSRTRNPVLNYDNQADPAAPVTITVRHAFGGLVAQCTWRCGGCLDGDDQGQALKWAQQDAAEHATRCHVSPLRPRSI